MRIPQHLKDRGIETIVGLDFETFWSQDYTLKKLSTTEYVRDPRFKAQCVGLRVHNSHTATWCHGGDIAHALANYDWSKTALLAHHAHFDGHILTHHYGQIPAYYLCTLSMARPLHGGEIRNDLDTLSRHYNGRGKHKDYLKDTKGVVELSVGLMALLGEGCAQDVNEMWRIFECMLPHYPDDELDLIHHTVRAYVEPVLQVHEKAARVAHKIEVRRKRQLLGRVALPVEVLRSREQFAGELRKLSVEPPMKVSPRTEKPTYAFAKDDLAFQELLEHLDPNVRDLVEARLAVSTSIEETRALRLLSHAKPALPIYLNYGKAHTLRWSGGDKMNPQNFGRESLLRRAILAPPGHKLVIVDSAQIEARMNAWLAGEEELLEAFFTGRDIYSEFAAQNIFGCARREVDKAQRFCGKVAVLGLGFQMGSVKFQYTLESGKMGMAVTLADEMYAQTVFAYRNRFPAIKQQWYTMQDMLTVMHEGREIVEYGPLTFEKGRVRLPNGMYLRYPNLKPGSAQPVGGRGNTRGIFRDRPAKAIFYSDWTYNEKTKIYGGLLTENVVQSLARCVVAEQILSVADRYRVALLVHDEVVLCVPEDQADQALKDTLAAFHTPSSWCLDLPVAGEGWIGSYYSKG